MIFIAVVGRHLIWPLVSVDTGGALEQKRTLSFVRSLTPRFGG
jgi:hypothetical protein